MDKQRTNISKKAFAAILMIGLAGNAQASDPLSNGVQKELSAMGLTDYNVSNLSSGQIHSLHLLLFSDKSSGSIRSAALAILDPGRHSIRSWFK